MKETINIYTRLCQFSGELSNLRVLTKRSKPRVPYIVHPTRYKGIMWTDQAIFFRCWNVFGLGRASGIREVHRTKTDLPKNVMERSLMVG